MLVRDLLQLVLSLLTCLQLGYSLQAQGHGDAGGKTRRSTKGSTGKAAGLQASKSSNREASSGKTPITAAAAGQASLKGSQGAAASAKDAGGVSKRRGRPSKQALKNPEDAATVTSEPQWSRRRRSASAVEEASVKDFNLTRRRWSVSAGAASLQAESEPSGGTKQPKRGGRRQRQLEAIAAGMLEKDAQEQGSAEAKGKAKPAERIRLPSFKDLDALKEQRMAGKLPQMDLTQEEGRHIAAHLSAFSKSAKMRDSARALYINTEVSNQALCDLLILCFIFALDFHDVVACF